MPIQPWESRPDLTEARLKVIAEGLLNVRHDTYAELATPLDDNYSRACATFGRQRQYLLQLALSKRYDWLGLASPAMDLTINIGTTPIRFFTDDHTNPKKQGYFRRNDVDQLFSTDDSEPVIFRFVIEPALTPDDEDRVFLLGHNAHQELVVEWLYRPVTSILHVIDASEPKAIVQADAKVGLKSTAIQNDDKAANDS